MAFSLYDRTLRGLTRVTDPTVEPITLDLAKRHLRVEIPDDDALIPFYLASARNWVERYTRLALMKQTWCLTLDRFPVWGDTDDATFFWLYRRGIIQLSVPPLASVDSVVYIDPAGVTQTLPSNQYVVDKQSMYARIEPTFGQFWPMTQFRMDTVKITFTCGYATAVEDNMPGDPNGKVPLPLKHAILLMLASEYENRGDVPISTSVQTLPMGVEDLLSSYRAISF